MHDIPYASGDVTIVANGLQTSPVNSALFSDILTESPKATVAIPDFATLDYSRYSLQLIVENRRMTVTDNNLATGLDSDVPRLVSRYIERAGDLSIEAIGFNFRAPLKGSRPIADVLTERYFNTASVKRCFGDPLHHAGLMVATQYPGYLLQTIVSPAWQKPYEALVSINYHFTAPFVDPVHFVLQRFNSFAAQKTAFLAEMVDAIEMTNAVH